MRLKLYLLRTKKQLMKHCYFQTNSFDIQHLYHRFRSISFVLLFLSSVLFLLLSFIYIYIYILTKRVSERERERERERESMGEWEMMCVCVCVCECMCVCEREREIWDSTGTESMILVERQLIAYVIFSFIKRLLRWSHRQEFKNRQSKLTLCLRYPNLN